MYADAHVVEAARHLVSREGGKLTVVIEQEIDVEPGQSATDHPLARMASQLKTEGKMQGLLEIRKAPKAAIEFLRMKKYCHHWMLMDERAYRLETDTEEVKAHVNFGDSATAGALVAIFDQLLYPKSEGVITIGG